MQKTFSTWLLLFIVYCCPAQQVDRRQIYGTWELKEITIASTQPERDSAIMMYGLNIHLHVDSFQQFLEERFKQREWIIPMTEADSLKVLKKAEEDFNGIAKMQLEFSNDGKVHATEKFINADSTNNGKFLWKRGNKLYISDKKRSNTLHVTELTASRLVMLLYSDKKTNIYVRMAFKRKS